MENLVRVDKLKRERCSPREFRGLVSSAEARLADAANPMLTLDSRFDLAYNAAHALAALRYRGYRSSDRYIVFQVLPHTLGLPACSRRLTLCQQGVRPWRGGGLQVTLGGSRRAGPEVGVVKSVPPSVSRRSGLLLSLQRL